MTTKTIRRLLKSDLRNPRVHPNGFIQLDLTDRRRLHLWHREIPRQKTRTPLHDHVFDMQSSVLSGRMINIEYTIAFTCGVDDADLKVYEPNPDVGGLVETGERAVELRRDLTLHEAGSSYSVHRGEFHESIPAGPAVTVIKKSNIASNGQSPCVLIPQGREPDNSFDRYDALTRDAINTFIDNLVTDEVAEALVSCIQEEAIKS